MGLSKENAVMKKKNLCRFMFCQKAHLNSSETLITFAGVYGLAW